MDQAALRIQLFYRLYLLCLAGMVLFSFVSVILFWKYDMGAVFAYFTNHQEKRAIKKMKKERFDAGTTILKNIPVKFRVEREVLFVHTEEDID